MPERQVLLEAAEKLEASMRELAEKFAAVDLFAHEAHQMAKDTKRLARWLAVGLVALALVVVAVWVVSDQAADANNNTKILRQYDVNACERGNTTRAGQRKQWEDARALLYGLGADKATRQLADALVANANKNFPALDCSVVREGKDPQPIAR